MTCEIPAEVATSTGLHRENSLRQFNYSQILGVPTASGMVPVVYRIMLRPNRGCGGGYRGIVHYGDTYTGLCELIPEYRHDIKCKRQVVYKFDALETYQSEEETRFKRKKGYDIIELPFTRTFYNGALYYRADYRAKNCSNSMCCYGYPADNDGIDETKVAPEAHAKVYPKNKQRSSKHKRTSGCGCGRKK